MEITFRNSKKDRRIIAEFESQFLEKTGNDYPGTTEDWVYLLNLAGFPHEEIQELMLGNGPEGFRHKHGHDFFPIFLPLLIGRLQHRDSPASITQSGNDPRDEWIYNQLLAGKVRAVVLEDLERKKGWDHILTEQGIGRAADRYAKRHGKPVIRRKK